MPVNLVYLLLATSAFFWGANFVLAGPVLAELPPLWAAALRFLLGAVLMLAIAWRQGDDLVALARRHGAVHLLLGLLGVVGFNLLFFHAMQDTSADNGALIMATNPLLTTLVAAVLLGERASARHLAALPIALAGVAVVISHGDLARLAHFQVAKGDLLMLWANLVWALYTVATRRFMPKGSMVGNTALMMSAGALVLTGIAMSSAEPFTLPGMHAGIALAIMVVGGTVFAYLFWSIGIQHLGAGSAALFLNLVPVFAMLISGALGTPPSAPQWIGGLIVLSGVGLAMMPTKRRIAT
jgi:drug/metabolite transporter (DMT)-like permease